MNKSGNVPLWIRELVVFAIISGIVISCRTTYKPTIDNSPGRATVYEDPGTVGRTQGIGIESQDIVSMTDKMMRDMFANPTLAAYSNPPRVIIDAAYFKNEGSQRINKNIIVDRLREGLVRAAAGRMVFIARHAAEMIELEKELKKQGVVDEGTIPSTDKTAGGDFRLIGSIKDLNQVDTRTGVTSRYVQITFEMVDLDKGFIVWGGLYEFKKSAQDDIIYRSPGQHN
jgi:penicillin-binding protein activator